MFLLNVSPASPAAVSQRGVNVFSKHSPVFCTLSPITFLFSQVFLFLYWKSKIDWCFFRLPALLIALLIYSKSLDSKLIYSKSLNVFFLCAAAGSFCGASDFLEKPRRLIVWWRRLPPGTASAILASSSPQVRYFTYNPLTLCRLMSQPRQTACVRKTAHPHPTWINDSNCPLFVQMFPCGPKSRFSGCIQ